MFDNIDSGTLGKALSIITCLLLATFLITSTDCGTHVLCYMDAEGATETPIKIRIVWGSLIAILAGVLLYAGGLKAIQSAAIMSVTLFKNLRREPQACMLLPEHARPKNDSLEESPPEKSSLQVIIEK
ncbi:choline-glycine betaine transporter [Acinetobacter baumannii]|nr:choline-glycine betaine transporter [Acinetobacter baumannii]